MLIIFSVNDQKITHDLKGQLVAGSVDIVQAAFKFDSSWDEPCLLYTSPSPRD